MKINIEYYAALCPGTGCKNEMLDVDVQTPRELFVHLASLYGWIYRQEHCMVAVNDCMVKWNVALQENDKVVFMMPFSGG